MTTVVDTIEINPDEKMAILNADEGHFLEVKSKKISPAKLTETLSAFANAAGGDLYIGIDEYVRGRKKIRKWNGFSNQEEANGHLQAFEQVFPLGADFTYVFLRCMAATGLVLKAEINKVREIKKASNGKIYVRRGAQNLPVETAQQRRQLEYDKGITSFETELLNGDASELEDSPIMKNFLSNCVPSSTATAFLHKQKLVISNKPTVAAALLFSEEPQALLPKHCAIKIMRYKTRETSVERDTLSPDIITVEGCTYNIIKKAVEQVVKVVEGIPILGEGQFIQVKYPDETLHEIITNAVLHRDYSIAADIQVRIYDNRIEVMSPGLLPGHITEKNILNEQCARNGQIVRLISKFPDPPNKDVGEGLNTAFDAMRKMKLKLPEIREGENYVTVYLYHEPLATPEKMVLDYLNSHSEITNTEARLITGQKSENSIKKVFNRLRNEGLIELVPSRRGSNSAWQKVGSESKEMPIQMKFDDLLHPDAAKNKNPREN